MDILVRWRCPRCEGKHPKTCTLCEKTGYLERWMPMRLDNEARITGRIIARRGRLAARLRP